MSGLRPSPRIRAERLAKEVRRRELEERRKGLSAPELAWERAEKLAPAAEIEELHRLVDFSWTQEPQTWALLETKMKIWELRERIMYRSAPTLAAIFRAQRCFFLSLLEWLEKEATEAYEGWSTRRPPGSAEAETVGANTEDPSELMRRRYALGTARINRMHAVHRGAEPVTDVEEANRLGDKVLEAVDAGDTDRVLRLVGRI